MEENQSLKPITDLISSEKKVRGSRPEGYINEEACRNAQMAFLQFMKETDEFYEETRKIKASIVHTS